MTQHLSLINLYYLTMTNQSYCLESQSGNTMLRQCVRFGIDLPCWRWQNTLHKHKSKGQRSSFLKVNHSTSSAIHHTMRLPCPFKRSLHLHTTNWERKWVVCRVWAWPVCIRNSPWLHDVWPNTEGCKSATNSHHKFLWVETGSPHTWYISKKCNKKVCRIW